MSGSASLTGQETITLTTPAGTPITVTLNQIAALVALQVPINLQGIVQQVILSLNGSGMITLPQSNEALTPLAMAQTYAAWVATLSTSDPGDGVNYWNNRGIATLSIKTGS